MKYIVDRDRRTLSLAAARVNAGLSRADVMRITGIADTAIGSYERGDVEPGAITIQVLCHLYGIGIDEIRFESALLKKKGWESYEGKTDGPR